MMDVDRLIAAWIAWDRAPGSEWTAREKEDALHGSGLPGRAAHVRIAAARRAGLSIPDAVQSVTNDQQEAA